MLPTVNAVGRMRILRRSRLGAGFASGVLPGFAMIGSYDGGAALDGVADFDGKLDLRGQYHFDPGSEFNQPEALAFGHGVSRPFPADDAARPHAGDLLDGN